MKSIGHRLLSLSIRVKIVGMVVGIIIAFSAGVIVLTRSEMGAGLAERLDELGLVLARDIAAHGASLILTGDTFALHDLIRQTLGNHPDVRYAFIVDSEGKVAAHSFPSHVPRALLTVNIPDPADSHSLRTIRTEEGLLRDVAVPIASGAAGSLHLGMSAKRPHATLLAVTAEIGLLSLLALAAGVVCTLFLTHLMLKPIFDLRRAVRAVAGGDLAVRTQVFAEDETGELSHAFNMMTDELQRQQNEIAALQSKLRAENVYLREELAATTGYDYIIGSDPELLRLLAAVNTAAQTNSAVLVLGESGTGKELIARALHERGPRAKNTLIKVNCAAIPVGLIESELFGHEKGAFTGAIRTHIGKFELADKSTLFLDEIADLSPQAQAKLLQVLQESVFTRVGGTTPIKVDVRLVVATNRDLAAELKADRFRLDLYHRIRVLEFRLPPLRNRTGDIPALALHFLRLCREKMPTEVEGISQETLAILCSYSWPGNIRELENVIERAIVLCRGKTITADHLPAELRDAEAAFQPTNHPAANANPRALADALRREKVLRVREALAQTAGNRAKAARLLGMDRSNFARLMKSLGL